MTMPVVMSPLLIPTCHYLCVLYLLQATLRDGSSVLLLIGNKRDVPHGDRQVSTREGEKLAEVNIINNTQGRLIT